ncbi:hypothetical protein S83_018459 [Arachis hypogaea]
MRQFHTSGCSRLHFAESTDILLMIVGTIAAIGNGMGMPLMTLIFGQMATSSLITCTAKILSTKFPRSV